MAAKAKTKPKTQEKSRAKVRAQTRRTTKNSAFKAGGYGRRSKNWPALPSSPDAVLNGSLDTLRERSRNEIRNNPMARRIQIGFTTHAIGSGIHIRSMADDKVFRAEANALLDEWVEESAADESIGLYGQQVLASNALVDAGELIIRKRIRRPEDGLSIPIQFQAMEADHLDTGFTEDLRGGGRITAGVEKNAFGQIVAYHLWRDHPSGSFARDNKRVRVPADEISHIKLPYRIGQTRGMPPLTHALLTLRDLGEHADAALVLQKTAAMTVGFLTQDPDAADETNPITGEDPTERDEDDVMTATMEPGTIQVLDPGENMTFSSPPDVGNGQEAFQRYNARLVAAGMGFPYEIVTGDWSQIDDRLFRSAMNDFKRLTKMYQKNVFGRLMLKDQIQGALIQAMVSGVLKSQKFAANPRAFLKWGIQPEPWEYIHPVQDVQAKIYEINNGLNSRKAYVTERGGNIETLDQEIADDKVRAEGLDLTFGSTVEKTDDSNDKPDEAKK